MGGGSPANPISGTTPPGVCGDRIHVGTHDGHVIGHGLPASGASVADGPAPGGAPLGAAYPNPFAGATTLELSLAKSGPVSVTVFDLRGRQVHRLVDGEVTAGVQQARHVRIVR